jgi:methylase of polypeptide subunit release factors
VQVHNSCFFAGAAALPETEALVANPPYIAAPDDDLLMPALYGGPDGANLTRVRS